MIKESIDSVIHYELWSRVSRIEPDFTGKNDEMRYSNLLLICDSKDNVFPGYYIETIVDDLSFNLMSMGYRVPKTIKSGSTYFITVKGYFILTPMWFYDTKISKYDI